MIRHRSRHAVFVLIVATGSIFVTLAVIEATLRLFPGFLEADLQHFIQATPENYGVSHPYIGHLHRPDHTFVLSGKDFNATHHTRMGSDRNRWPWPKQADIVVLGDSVTFSQGVEDEEAWPAILARSLPGTRAINLGLIGAGPQQYLRVYETFGAKLHAKLVIVGLLLRNDLLNADWVRSLVEIRAGGNYAVWRDFGRPEIVFSPTEPIKSWMRKLRWELSILAKRSHLFNLILHVIRGARKWRPSEVRAIELPKGNRLQLAPADFRRSVKGANPGHPEFDLTLAALTEINSTAKSVGAKTLVIFLPGKEEAYLPLLENDVPDASVPVREELKKRGIEYLDWGPAFRDRAAKGEKLFFETDGHPNVRGYALIAAEVIAHLKDNARGYRLPHLATSP